jgi:hypothetical protein
MTILSDLFSDYKNECISMSRPCANLTMYTRIAENNKYSCFLLREKVSANYESHIEMQEIRRKISHMKVSRTFNGKGITAKGEGRCNELGN